MAEMTQELDLQTEYLRLKASIYDSNTDLLAVPGVLDSVRTLLDNARWVGVIHVEIDALSRIESIYGWQVCDRLLRAVSAVLHEARGEILKRDSTLTQSGIYGGSFVVFQPLPGDSRAPLDTLEQSASAVGQRLTERFGSAEFHTMSPPISFNIGYSAFMDQPFFRLERLIYRAIEEARALSLRTETQQRSREHAELKRIIQEGDIEVVFQPIVDLRSSRTLGYEAFSRGPRDSVFERPKVMFECSRVVGVARELDLLCQRRALDRARMLAPGDKLFLNTLPASLLDPGFREHLLTDLPDGLNVAREDIVIEIADRDSIGDYEIFGQEIAELRARGFLLAVDDVGTGASSLQTIAEIRPDFIKIDGSLIRNIQASLVKQEMLRSLCQVARSIGATIVAEGIESAEELAVVRECGIGYGQGYFFAIPHHDLPTARREA